MCAIAGGHVQLLKVAAGIEAMRHRGPDSAATAEVNQILSVGHARLSILDLDRRSDQPFRYRGWWLIFNGEIWNYKALRRELEERGKSFSTSGDTEVLAAALYEWGIDGALPRLEGMFAFAWVSPLGTSVALARDRFGEVPLHYSLDPFAFASERKGLIAMGVGPEKIYDLGPGCTLQAPRGGWEVSRWYTLGLDEAEETIEKASGIVLGLLRAGVAERIISDVPICTLVSGGIDSSIILKLLKELSPGIVAYTAVHRPMCGDLKNSRALCRELGVELREVQVPLPRPEDLQEVVRIIETSSKAQVEIGWACTRLADAIRADGFKVTFSGEGSDELWASYGFAYYGIERDGWHDYRVHLVAEQHRKNFARCNKVFMSRGVECRLPFLHRPLVEYALSLPRDAVSSRRSRPKEVLQRACSGLIPDSIVRRAKVAFQDGMGLKDSIARSIENPAGLYRMKFEEIYGKKSQEVLPL